MVARDTDTAEGPQASAAPPAARNASAMGWPIFMLFISGIIWGLFYSLNRFAVTGGIPFLAYVFWMGAGASVLLFLLCLFTRSLPSLRWVHLRAYLVLGTISFGLSYTVLAIAAPEVPVGVLSLGATLTPILTYPAASLFKLDRFSLLRTLGLVCGLGAVALIVVPETSLPSPGMVPWVLLGMVTPILYVANAIIIALLKPPPSGALPLACGTLVAGSLFMLVVTLVSGQWWWFEGPMSDGDWALVLAACVLALAFYLMIEIIRLAGPVIFTAVNFIVPLAAIGWGILFFGESHSPWIWAALALMIVGVFLVNRPSKTAA
ncbi:MAG: DMT family transporter [Proteobacteria bacterium]|nr:DMT family transporter [Pseudomonadota bacterium]